MYLIFLTYFFVFPALILILLQVTKFSLLRLGLIQFVTVRLFIFSFIGTLPLFFGLDQYRLNSGVDDPYLILQVMLFSGTAILFFVAGATVAKTILNTPNTANSFSKIYVNKTEPIFLALLLIISISVLIIYLSQQSSIAILAAIAGEGSLAERRSSMTNDFQGKYHWYRLFMIELAQVVSFSLFCSVLITKKRWVLIVFLMSFCSLAFALTMSAQKSPIAWFFVGLFMVYATCRNHGKYSVQGILILGVIMVLTLAAMYIITGFQSDIYGAFLSVISRAFAGSVQPAYHYLEFFPQEHDFLMGGSFPNPGGLFPWGGYRLPVEIMNWTRPELAERGIVGSMPTVFWAEAFANFGYLGIIVVPLLFGFLLFFVDHYVSKIRDTPIKVGFYVWMILHYSSLAQTGFSKFVIDIKMIVLLTIFLIVISLSNRMKIGLKGKSIE